MAIAGYAIFSPLVWALFVLPAVVASEKGNHLGPKKDTRSGI